MAKIFESPDGGKTVYQREQGSSERELVKSTSSQNRQLIAIPESLILENPNDADLGYAVRKFYWQSKS